jgi:uncharacterized protein YeaO (DUF488 family)
MTLGAAIFLSTFALEGNGIMNGMIINIKRVYEKPAKTDGFRILVDRLWPRGLTKKKARVDLWLKDVAPSTELRQWFGHDPARWQKFTTRYAKELAKNKPEVKILKEAIKAHKVCVLVYGAKDEVHNNAAVLRKFLK